MEFKVERSDFGNQSDKCRDRNRVEFKGNPAGSPVGGRVVEIETEWNLKITANTAMQSIIVVEIETEWNLKLKTGRKLVDQHT